MMIAGLPWTAWLLLIASIGLGLSIVLIFYFSHRRNGKTKPDTISATDGTEKPNPIDKMYLTWLNRSLKLIRFCFYC